MATEAPNTLLSNTRLTILDVLSEGPIGGFWPQSGTYGSNPLASTLFNGVPVINGDGSPNFNTSGQGFSFSYNSGTSGQSALTGYEKVEALVPLPANTRVSNPPPNASFPSINGGYPQSVVTSFNTTMYPDAEAIKVTTRFPAVFTTDPTNGDTNGFDIGWQVFISINNGPFTVYGTHSLSDFAASPKCTSAYLNTQVYTLPKLTPAASYYEWKVKVSRTTQNVLSINTQNEMYVDSIAVVSNNTYRYPMTAMAGISISADQFGDIPVRAYEIKGIQPLVPDGYTPTRYNQQLFTRQCDIDVGKNNVGMTTQTSAQLSGIVVGTVVNGSGLANNSLVTFVMDGGPGAIYFSVSPTPIATAHNTTVTFLTPYVDKAIYPATYPTIWTGGLNSRQWTDNPAWIFYDLVTNKRYGLGNYIRPEWIDKWTLYQIAQYCDELVDDGNGGLEPRFTCNIVINTPDDAYTLLNNFVSVFRGMIYWANGTIAPVGGETRNPVFNFTNSNVVKGAFSYADTPRNTRSTVCVVKWLDPSNQYRATPERVEDIVGIGRFGYIEKQITAFATTSRGQAIRAANWLLTVEQLLTETIQFQTDMEGMYLRPGDVFNVYDNFRNNQQQGGRIVNFGTGREVVTLDRPVNLLPGFVYTMAATVPATNFIGTGNITDSDQISLIRNAQIETRQVTTSAANGVQTLSLISGFSSGLFKGSPWILNASGASVTVFDQATQYRCLTTSEPQAGVVEVVGVKYNTGINFLVNNNYSTVVSPPVIGDTTPPNPPTGLQITEVTGLQNNNTFYAYLTLAWSGSASSNVTYYNVSGQVGAAAPFLVARPTTTGLNWVPTQNGMHTFSVSAVNANGYESAYDRSGFNVLATNPLGVTAALSGLYIANNADIYYIRPSDAKFTGYVGTQPTFGWHISLDTNGFKTPTAQFITGYRVRLLKLGNEGTTLSSGDIVLSGFANTNLTLDPRYLYTGTTVKPLRGFTVSVETVDTFGNYQSGARLAVNNPQPPPPINSGFVGYNGGISYNVTPAPQSDTSGIYIWYDRSQSYVPTYDNVAFTSTNFGGNINTPYQTGIFYTWFSIVDSYGFSGSVAANGDYNAPIYGPISGNTNQVFNAFQFDITNQLTGAFNYLTGKITNLQTQLSTTGYQMLLIANGLSGDITGSGTQINQALSVQIQQTVNTTGLALSSQINAVSARLVTTGANNAALAGTVMDALATTGGALSSWIQQVGAQTTGVTASVHIGAQAFVTGSVNGLGGAAVATWGFQLDANGKVVSMQATSNSFPGTYGTIVFGGADLQSDNFVAGSAGWRLTHDGSFTGNNGTFRGALDIGATPNKLTMSPGNSFYYGDSSLGNVQINSPGSDTINLLLNHAGTTTMVELLSTQVAGSNIGEIVVYSTDRSQLTIAGSPTAGSAPAITWNGDTNLYRSAANMLKTDYSLTVAGTITGNTLNAYTTAVWSNGIQYKGVPGGGNAIGFAWNGANVKVYVDGTVQGTIPNP